jgi:hypothetical protein
LAPQSLTWRQSRGHQQLLASLTPKLLAIRLFDPTLLAAIGHPTWRAARRR